MKLEFLDHSKVLEVLDGVSILESAVNADIPLNHDCGGNCACTTCRVWVEKGAELLSPMSEDERSLLEANDKLDGKSRLACQTRLVKDGEVSVKIPKD